MNLPAIVVTAYDRPESLMRLLHSIQLAKYPQNESICLHISIDHEGNPLVLEIADSFEWAFGTKKVIYQPEHLGLVEHILAAGDLTAEYGSIIFLEDDLAMSPMYYRYAAEAVDFYEDEEQIAGISLYNLWFNGYTHAPFTPYPDGSDVFFLQVPFFLGQVLLHRDWKRFRAWMESGKYRPVEGDPLHEIFLTFDEQDWFPIRTKYLVENNLYYVFPRASLSTGFGDVGTHFAEPTRYFQVPILRGEICYQFMRFDESPSVYDSFYEILPDRLNRLTSDFTGFSYDIDLNATKSAVNISHENVLTTQRCAHSIMSFGLQLFPIEANIIQRIPGGEISFCRKSDLKSGWFSKILTENILFDYYNRDRKIKWGLLGFFKLINFIKKINPFR